MIEENGSLTDVINNFVDRKRKVESEREAREMRRKVWGDEVASHIEWKAERWRNRED